MEVSLEKADYQERLVFNPAKTVAVVFHTKNKPQTIPPLTMQGQDITFADSTRYLGIILDSRLSWRKHVLNQVTKCKKILMMSHAAVGRTWGLDAKKCWWLYQAIARPVLTYGAIVWAWNDILKSMGPKLDTIQRMAMLMMTSVMRSTPTNGLQVILDIPPLDLHVRWTALATRYRIKDLTTQNWDGLTRRKTRPGMSGH